MEQYLKLVDFLRNLLISWGVSPYFADIFKVTIVILAILFLAWMANFIAKRIILGILHMMVKKSKTTWDDIIFERKVFNRLSLIAPAAVIYHSVKLPLNDYPGLVNLAQTLCSVYMVIISLLVLLSFLDALHEIFLTLPVSKERTIKGYIQVVKIILYVIASIIIISILSGVPANKLFTGLGAMAAVLMLVFKDTILGLVASIQLSANDMLKPGDWIEMPAKKADGTVIDISLTTVKVQNWDKTIVTIPTYALVSESFTNWRGMEQSEGRRIKKTFNVDVNTVRFCDSEMVERFKKMPYLDAFLNTNQKEQFTNLTIFRYYIEEYLRRFPYTNIDMTILATITTTEGGNGIAVQYTAFLKEKAGIPFEKHQSFIFEHFLAVLKDFDLKIFQAPTGNDFRMR
ncbi:MAG TPA: mechanosensitive ion channel domain-containing protein [Bacteroidales bacterium]|nr:mechanosensitive ion channel domain-containing protein [Bacteroidales bacterium]